LKKILALLSLFLFISTSLANPLTSIPTANNEIHYIVMDVSIISLLLFFVLFIIGIIKVIIYNKKITKDEVLIEERKKLSNKSILFLIFPFLAIALYVFVEWLDWGSWSAMPIEGNNRIFILEYIKEYIILATLILSIIVIKFIKAKTTTTYKILFYTLILVLIIVACFFGISKFMWLL